MDQLDVDLITHPFPHLVIRNTFNEDELKLIWRELEFLNSPLKLSRPDTNGTAIDATTGMPLSNNFSVFLDSVYQNRDISDILRINKKVIDPAIAEAFVGMSPLLGHMKSVNHYTTKIRYYETGEYYRGHTDTSRFTAVSYFFKEPKSFKGGELHFDEFDYTFEIENNSTIIFVGSIMHSTTELTMTDNAQRFSGFGRYAMTQFLNIRERNGELL
jgi:hypothetical protein